MNKTRSNTPDSQGAFTLLELLVVMALTAILAGMAIVSFRGPYEAARLENVMAQVTMADRQIRDRSLRHARPGRIVIHLDAGTISGEQLDNEGEQAPPLRIDGGACFDQLLLGGHRINCGEAAVAVSSRGQTPTYAIRFKKPGGGHRWLVFLGLTGQSIQLNDESEIEHLQRLLEAQGTDAR